MFIFRVQEWIDKLPSEALKKKKKNIFNLRKSTRKFVSIATLGKPDKPKSAKCLFQKTLHIGDINKEVIVFFYVLIYFTIIIN